MKNLIQCVVVCGASLFLVACTSSGPQKAGSEDKSNVTVSCLTQVHATKPDSTADFAACRYNNNEDPSATSKCMLDHGWSVKPVCPGDKLVHARAAIERCLLASKSENHIDHKLMNECLAMNEQKEESQGAKLMRLMQRGCQTFRASKEGGVKCADKSE